MRVFAFLIFLTISCSALAVSVIDAETPLFNSTDEFWRQVKVAKTKLGSFNLINFVSDSGYPIEEHKVVTDDGYRLTLHRIPYGKVNKKSVSRPVVLFMHGILTSSASFITAGPDRSLPMLLADQDYDVWLGNNRGNTYSRDHTTLDPDKDAAFWKFSFEDLGTKDLPAIIDFILNTTDRENLTYVGHSQGTSQIFALLALIPEYNQKVVLVNALAPMAFMGNVSGPITKILSDNLVPVRALMEKSGVGEVFGESSLVSGLLYVICSIREDICLFVISLLAGFDPTEIDKADILAFVQHFPSGTSLRSLTHYGQEVESGHFRQFDYGVIGNVDTYGEGTAPDFNISNIQSPIALFYGENDWLASYKDVEEFADQLETTVWRQKISYKYFNHFDFLCAKHVNELLNFDVINLINVYNSKENLTTTTSTSTEIITTTGTGSGTKTALHYCCFLITMIVFIIDKIVIR